MPCKKEAFLLWKPELELYEVFRVINGVPLFLNDHLLRLKNSFEGKGLEQTVQTDEIKAIVLNLVAENEICHGNIRISFDIGNIPISFVIGQILAIYPSDAAYRNGVHAALLSAERLLPSSKIYQGQVQKAAKAEIERTGAYDVILENHLGQLTEGSRTNVFFIQGTRLLTSPVRQVLPGITRKKVAQICLDNDILLEERIICREDVQKMDGAFFTGTSPKILPIHSIGMVGYDCKHRLIRHLMCLFDACVDADLSVSGKRKNV